jgi:hypothetical protein
MARVNIGSIAGECIMTVLNWRPNIITGAKSSFYYSGGFSKSIESKACSSFKTTMTE